MSFCCLDIRSILRRVQTSQLRDADVVPGPDPDVQVVAEGQEERNHQHENKIRNGTRKTRICFQPGRYLFKTFLIT